MNPNDVKEAERITKENYHRHCRDTGTMQELNDELRDEIAAALAAERERVWRLALVKIDNAHNGIPATEESIAVIDCARSALIQAAASDGCVIE